MKKRLETLAIHAGQKPDPVTGAIMTPVYLTSTYVQDGPGEHKGYEYSRTHNLTRFALEDNIAALEGGKYGFAFASGLAAMTTLLHTLRSGDHVICCDDVYGGTYRLFDKVLTHMGLQFTFADLANPAALEQHIRPNTRMLWLESPTNPLLKVLDIEALASRAAARGLLTVVDNTFMSPYWQNPLDLGADVVVHSTTKFINGHSDVVGGVIVTSKDDLAQRLKFLQNAIGAIPGPLDCFLVLRGVKTLPVRMKQHEENAHAVAQFLEGHPQVSRVIYPGLPGHPQHELAKRQARGFGGMISFDLKGGLESARRFLKTVRIFACAESLGGVESLIEHPAIMTHASIEKPKREALGITDGLIRVSVGIENADDLIDDLKAGFAAAA
ncbi:MAG: Cystathionine beta-lyase [Myxococcota bacterium]|nr:Cystathionine beta-lyase [Myxococcota bacterium]